MHDMPGQNLWDVWELLGGILLILALAGFVIPVLQRFRISPVLGYLLCGLLIGPYALGQFAADFPWMRVFVITDEHLISAFAELGVVFLLFVIGLELTFSRLWEMRRYVLGLGGSQIIVTALVFILIALQFGNDIPVAIIVGSALALSSTAIVMQLMMEQHMLSRPIGRICFAILLMQDLAVVPILVFVSVFAGSGDGGIWFLLGKSILMAVLVVAAMFAAGKLLLRPLLRIASPSRNAEWLMAVTMFLVIGAASLTHFAGLSAALGAFLAGLLVSETEYRHEIEVITEPVKGLLMGIFFLSVGMATDIAAIIGHPFWIVVSVIGIFVIKAGVIYPLARLFGVPKEQAAQASVMLAQCGEFGFIVVGLAVMGDMITQTDAHFFQLVVTVSMLLTPFMSRLAPLAQYLVCRTEDRNLSETPSGAAEGGHVIIAGFGRVGQTMAEILEGQGIPYVAMDTYGPHVAHLRAEGYPVIFGQARHIELWRRLNAENARAAVITIDQHAATIDILRELRRNWPMLPVILRVKDTDNLETYYAHGATAVVPETLEATLQLVRTLLEHSGIKQEEAREIISQYRREALIGEKG